MDAGDSTAPIAFRSCRSCRVTRPVHATEVIAFTDLFDEAFAIKDTIAMAIANGAQLHLLAYPKTLFDIISKVSTTNKRRLMIDVYAVRKGYKAHKNK